jgi:hypothetical protein
MLFSAHPPSAPNTHSGYGRQGHSSCMAFMSKCRLGVCDMFAGASTSTSTLAWGADLTSVQIRSLPVNPSATVGLMTAANPRRGQAPAAHWRGRNACSLRIDWHMRSPTTTTACGAPVSAMVKLHTCKGMAVGPCQRGWVRRLQDVVPAHINQFSLGLRMLAPPARCHTHSARCSSAPPQHPSAPGHATHSRNTQPTVCCETAAIMVSVSVSQPLVLAWLQQGQG